MVGGRVAAERRVSLGQLVVVDPPPPPNNMTNVTDGYVSPAPPQYPQPGASDWPARGREPAFTSYPLAEPGEKYTPLRR